MEKGDRREWQKKWVVEGLKSHWEARQKKLLKRTNHFKNFESNENGYRKWNTNRGKGLQTKVEKMQMDERGYKQKWNKCKWMKGVTDKNWDGKKMKIVNQNLSDRQTTTKVSYRSVSKALLTLKKLLTLILKQC